MNVIPNSIAVWPGREMVFRGIILFFLSTPLFAAEEEVKRPTPKPVPDMQVLPLPDHQASFQREGRELTRYWFAPRQERPFLYPLNGPSGRSLTRMGHPRDPVGHSHHNSVWITHHDVQGVDFWGDKGKGRIVPQRLEMYEDSDDAAFLVAMNHWVDTESNRVLLEERRRVSVIPLLENEYLVLLDLEFSASGSRVTLGKTPFGMIGVRMAKTIGVHDGGGRILNSEGQVNEKEVFWKPARWVDYSGPITPLAQEGIALLDHPSNPKHPSVFHVRDDGWMGACLTFDAPRTIVPGESLRLRYGLYVHAEALGKDALDKQWKSFSELPVPDKLLPSKK